MPVCPANAVCWLTPPSQTVACLWGRRHAQTPSAPHQSYDGGFNTWRRRLRRVGPRSGHLGEQEDGIRAQGEPRLLWKVPPGPASLPVTGPFPRAHKTEGDLQVTSCVSPCRPTGADWAAGARWLTCAGGNFTRAGLAHGPRVAGQGWQGPVGWPWPISPNTAVPWPVMGIGREGDSSRPGLEPSKQRGA